MNDVTKLCFAALFCLVVSVAFHVHAHQQKEAISTVLFNARTGQIEVAHRLNLHDAQHIVKRVLNKQADLIKDKKAQASFARYVAAHFSLSLDDGDVLPIELIGEEILGQYFWVYQEIPYASNPSQVTVRFNALMEIWPSQRNTVNIEGLGTLRSFELLSAKDQQSVTF